MKCVPIRLLTSGFLFVALAIAPQMTFAHGNTIRVSYASIRPERLVIEVGATVHFHNANTSGAPCTVVIGDGLAQSPGLGRAEGWHHTFETPGEYRYHLKEYPSREGVVVVVVP